jgi:hypothetical protein
MKDISKESMSYLTHWFSMVSTSLGKPKTTIELHPIKLGINPLRNR